MGRRVASLVATLPIVASVLLGAGCTSSDAPTTAGGGAGASAGSTARSTGAAKSETCDATTQVSPRTDDHSDGAIAPAHDGIPSGAPDAAHLAGSFQAHGIGMSSYLASMEFGLTLAGTKEAVLCPDGRLFIRGSDPTSQPVKTGVGLVTLSGAGGAVPYHNGREPLFWHPAQEILGSHPCAALVNDSFGPQLVYAADLDNLDPIDDKPAS